jgi:ligand-binding sensor domain-containing protein
MQQKGRTKIKIIRCSIFGNNKSTADLYVGDLSNGIFKFYNNYQSYDVYNDKYGFLSLAISNYGIIFSSMQNGIYKSTDNCASWSLIKSNTSAYCLFITSKDVLLAGSSDGVYISNDGSNLIRASSALPNISKVYDFTEDSEGYLYAATWGSGIYVSKDGSVWTQISASLPIPDCWSIKCGFGDTLYVGTYGNGLHSLFFDTTTGWQHKDLTLGTALAKADVRSMCYANNNIYLGTTDGVFSKNTGSVWVNTLQGFICCMNAIGGTVFAGLINSSNGLLYVSFNEHNWIIVQ